MQHKLRMRKVQPTPLGLSTEAGDICVAMADLSVAEVNRRWAGFQAELRRLVRKIWPVKPAQSLAYYADITDRQAQRFLAGDDMSFHVFWRIAGRDDRFIGLFWNSL